MTQDDPRLTAYVLGELDPPERAEIEKLLARDPEAAQEVAELREFTALVRTQLAAEEAPPLSEESKRGILSQATAKPVAAGKIVPMFARPRVWIPAALAACLTVIAFYKTSTLVRMPLGKTDATPAPEFKISPEPLSQDAPGLPESAPEISLAETESAPMPAKPSLAAPVEVKELAASRMASADAKPVSSLSSPATPASGASVPNELNQFAFTSPAAPAAQPGKAASNGPVFGSGGTSSGGMLAGRVGAKSRSFYAGAPAGSSASDVSRHWKKGERPALAVADTTAKKPVLASDTLRQDEPGNTESYDAVQDNAFLAVAGNPLSTFSIDVDTASYANVRRFLTSGTRPPKGAVRIEELVNYFPYSYPQPKEGEPFSVNMEVASCPWEPQHRLLRIGLKAREIAKADRPAANLVFLVDVSGSMMEPNKLPLVKESLRLLIEQLSPKDTVAIAVYAGASGTALEPTSDKAAVREALDRLEAGGSTNGAAGLRLAYDLAQRNFVKGKTNRVILATDGDFNVGTTSQSELNDLITAKAKSGVFLTVLGYGYGNLKDSTMEKLADKGNGNYAYVDTIAEGRKVLVEQMAGTLITVAKDVKMQIEFNPQQVGSYRLIGYENRLLAKEDFNDDTKDAGEIGSGHTVTALYELVPAQADAAKLPGTDPLKYQPVPATSAPEPPRGGAKPSPELLTLKLRWKAPEGDKSTKSEFPLIDSGNAWDKSSRDFRWAAAVASFGMILRDSPHQGSATWSTTRELAVEGKGDETTGYRQEFLGLIDKAAALAPMKSPEPEK